MADTADQRGVDGGVNGIHGLIGYIGAGVSSLQSGSIGLYALSSVFGAVALLLWLVVHKRGPWQRWTRQGGGQRRDEESRPQVWGNLLLVSTPGRGRST